MSAQVKVVLYGSLRSEGMAHLGAVESQMPLDEPTSVQEVIRRANIPLERVQLAIVNHHTVPRDSTVRPGDRVAFFPVEYPIYPDWNDFRF